MKERTAAKRHPRPVYYRATSSTNYVNRSSWASAWSATGRN
jgi:hypothetical protein